MTNGMAIAGIRMKRTSFLWFSGGSGEGAILRDNSKLSYLNRTVTMFSVEHYNS